MKKILLFAAFAILAAASAFGAGATNSALSLTSTGLTAYGGDSTATCTVLIGKTSTGVGLGWVTGATGYAIWTQHKSGNRAFGGSWDSTAIYYTDVTAGTAVASMTTTASDSTAFASWTTM
ncbi:hypothetical protein [Geomonas sp.]|uniref:hypothetical protein n=1 Tax=Geomonas sp. TaxID=2651584 RepID=UPI002B47A6FA|nr:hypothetical protein [Geomonas sp.]HJV37186.1 hypothetical protein [Geomonas sp.]